MAGPSKKAPIMPVNFYDHLTAWTKQLEIVPLGTGATFPAATIVTIDGSGNAVNYDTAVHNVAVSEEAAGDLVNVEAGPQLFAAAKSEVYVVPIGDKRLIMTAGYTGATPVIYDPATHLNQKFEGVIDSASGFVFIDLTTVGSATGPFTIVGLYEAPGLPEPLNTSLPTDRRVNARVIVEVDPTAVYTP